MQGRVLMAALQAMSAVEQNMPSRSRPVVRF
jgi:hypothetical protein